jgi:hypothetical protein
MIYHLSDSSQTPTPKAHWGRRAQTALDKLTPAERTLVTNRVSAMTGPATHGGDRRPDIRRVTGGRGLWILRVSERVRVLFRPVENDRVEIVDVVAREGGRMFSELY